MRYTYTIHHRSAVVIADKKFRYQILHTHDDFLIIFFSLFESSSFVGVVNLSAVNFTVSILQTGRNNAREVMAASAVTDRRRHCVGMLYYILYHYDL